MPHCRSLALAAFVPLLLTLVACGGSPTSPDGGSPGPVSGPIEAVITAVLGPYGNALRVAGDPPDENGGAAISVDAPASVRPGTTAGLSVGIDPLPAPVTLLVAVDGADGYYALAEPAAASQPGTTTPVGSLRIRIAPGLSLGGIRLRLARRSSAFEGGRVGPWTSVDLRFSAGAPGDADLTGAWLANGQHFWDERNGCYFRDVTLNLTQSGNALGGETRGGIEQCTLGTAQQFQFGRMRDGALGEDGKVTFDLTFPDGQRWSFTGLLGRSTITGTFVVGPHDQGPFTMSR